MPFITEELWHVLRAKVGATGWPDGWPDSILAARYPASGPVDEEAERAFGPVIGIVDAIRNIRGEMNIPFKVVLEDVEVGSLDAAAERTVREEAGRIHRLANVREASIHPAGTPPEKKGGSAVAVGAGFEVRVGLAGAIDVQAELARIDKEFAKLEQDLEGIARKLANPSFVAKAPPEVVEKDRARAEELREKRGKLEAHRAMLSGTESSHRANDRRPTMENQNPQDPGQAPPSQPASTPVVEQAQQAVTAVTDAAKAGVAAIVEGAGAAIEKVKRAFPKRKPAKKAKAKKAAPKRKVAARKAAPKKAAKKIAKKAKARKPARKPARKAAKRTKKR
jgi:valyl-tRNA synthetase